MQESDQPQFRQDNGQEKAESKEQRVTCCKTGQGTRGKVADSRQQTIDGGWRSHC
jgi:hypothetical protein